MGQKAKPIKETILNRIYSRYKQNAKQRNIDFALGKIDFENLIFKSCYYCGALPALRNLHITGVLYTQGIDRVDNTKGYEVGNCVPCCKFCNRAKWKHTLEELDAWLKRVSNTLGLKGII